MTTAIILLIIFVFLFGVYLRLSKDDMGEKSDRRQKYWAKYEDK
jgi:hypothetical protein